MSYKIREAQREDMPAVWNLIRQLAIYEREPEAVEITVEDLIRDGFGKTPLFKCLVAEEEKQILGMALFYYRYSTWKGKTVHLEDLIVEEEHRQKGIGMRLLKEVLLHADSEKVKRIEWAVLDWNTPAISLYEKIGAGIYREWDVVQMSRTSYLRALEEYF